MQGWKSRLSKLLSVVQKSYKNIILEMQLSNSPALLLDFPKGVCCRWYPVPFSCCRRKCRAVFIYCSPKQVKLNQKTVEPQTRTSKQSHWPLMMHTFCKYHYICILWDSRLFSSSWLTKCDTSKVFAKRLYFPLDISQDMASEDFNSLWLD